MTGDDSKDSGEPGEPGDSGDSGDSGSATLGLSLISGRVNPDSPDSKNFGFFVGLPDGGRVRGTMAIRRAATSNDVEGGGVGPGRDDDGLVRGVEPFSSDPYSGNS